MGGKIFFLSVDHEAVREEVGVGRGCVPSPAALIHCCLIPLSARASCRIFSWGLGRTLLPGNHVADRGCGRGICPLAPMLHAAQKLTV